MTMSLFAFFYMLVTYLVGSIPSVNLLSRLTGFKTSSHENELALSVTDIYRQGRKGAALSTLICDMLKGTLPVWLGYYLGLTQFELGMVALGACLGHIFPIFAKFRGGKGVATAFGAIAPIAWGVCFTMLGTWFIVFLISGYTALSAVVTALTVPFYVWYFKPEFTFPVALVCCLLVYRHHDNIQRLWRGQEEKLWTALKKPK